MVELFYLWLVYEIFGLLLIKVMPKDRCYMAPALIAGAVQAGAGLLQTGVGIAQKIKAAKMARVLGPQPLLKDNKYLDEAYSFAESQAGQGLTDASRQAFVTNNDRNVSSGIDAILKSGGSANNIGDLIDSGSNAVRQMALADQEIRMRNQRAFLTALEAKAEEDRDQFMVNEMAPWQDKAALIADLNKQGAASIWGGINTMGRAAIGYAQSNMYGDGIGQNAPAAEVAAPGYSAPNMTAIPLQTGTPGSPASTFNDLSTEALLKRHNPFG